MLLRVHRNSGCILWEIFLSCLYIQHQHQHLWIEAMFPQTGRCLRNYKIYYNLRIKMQARWSHFHNRFWTSKYFVLQNRSSDFHWKNHFQLDFCPRTIQVFLTDKNFRTINSEVIICIHFQTLLLCNMNSFKLNLH